MFFKVYTKNSESNGITVNADTFKYVEGNNRCAFYADDKTVMVIDAQDVTRILSEDFRSDKVVEDLRVRG